MSGQSLFSEGRESPRPPPRRRALLKGYTRGASICASSRISAPNFLQKALTYLPTTFRWKIFRYKSAARKLDPGRAGTLRASCVTLINTDQSSFHRRRPIVMGAELSHLVRKQIGKIENQLNEVGKYINTHIVFWHSATPKRHLLLYSRELSSN